MENCIFNGEIYIKIKPDVEIKYDVVLQDGTHVTIDGDTPEEEIMEKICLFSSVDKNRPSDSVNYYLNESKDKSLIENFENNCSISDKLKAYVREKCFIKSASKSTVYNNRGFFQIFVSRDAFEFVDAENNVTLSYSSMDEVENNFMSLRRYLADADFKNIELTPKTDDRNSASLVYTKYGMSLIYDGKKYMIMSDEERNFYYGACTCLDNFYNKEDVYRNIVKQVIAAPRLKK